MDCSELLGPIDPAFPYDDALDPYVRAFVHVTFRETKRDAPENAWLDRIGSDTPDDVASMIHATAHFSVRWDKPFRDVVSFGLGEPRKEPYWHPSLDEFANLLEFGSLYHGTLYVTWDAKRARLILCDEEGGVRDEESVSGFVFEGIEALLRPDDEDERDTEAKALALYTEHIAQWANRLAVRVDGCRAAAADVNAAMEALDLEADGAEAKLDQLAASESRLAAQISRLEPALFRARNALRTLSEA